LNATINSKAQNQFNGFIAEVLGIDLGTTISCMAVIDGGDPEGRKKDAGPMIDVEVVDEREAA